MDTKFNLNTIILILVLLAFVIGAIVVVGAVQRAAQPLEEAKQVFQERIEAMGNPTPTIIVDPVSVIHEVRSLSRLETASYSVEKVITAESGQGPLNFLFGDRLILVAHGQVIAGVDLGKITEGDLTVSADGTAFVTLPAAEILVVNLDNQQSYVYDRDTGLIGQNPALESEARKAAEQEILNAALEDGILDMAQRNAELYILRLLLALGFHDVRFTEVPPVSTPTPAQ